MPKLDTSEPGCHFQFWSPLILIFTSITLYAAALWTTRFCNFFLKKKMAVFYEKVANHCSILHRKLSIEIRLSYVFKTSIFVLCQFVKNPEGWGIWLPCGSKFTIIALNENQILVLKFVFFSSSNYRKANIIRIRKLFAKIKRGWILDVWTSSSTNKFTYSYFFLQGQKS